MRAGRLGVVTAVALMIVAVAPPAQEALAQHAKRPFRIGAIHAAFAPNHPAFEGLKAGLKELGLEEGRDVTFDNRFTEGRFEVMPGMAAELVTAGVDLIFAVGEAATRAAMASTPKIPVVFTVVGDPVAAGVVAEIARPGGNVTGVSSLYTELVAKRLEILKTLVPALRRVWAIYYPADASEQAAVRKAQEAAPLLKLEVVARPVRTPAELAGALKSLRPGDGLLAPSSPALDIPGQIAERTTRVPSVFPAVFWVRHGVLVSYGSDYFAEGRQAARLVAKLLRGARPRDLPVEGSNTIELGINLKTAKTLGLAIPQTLRLRANHLVE
ncbi:MAG: ABC transporter substrate-binding protein [Candidatus Rokubacteria bacterium]|nr:ABC transporter substrate-binding protein [Candidatus Rokubacteria bacterium]